MTQPFLKLIYDEEVIRNPLVTFLLFKNGDKITPIKLTHFIKKQDCFHDYNFYKIKV